MSLTFSPYNMGASTKLFSKVDPDDTVFIVSTGDGPRMETPSGTYFIATVRDGNLMERVMVTRVTGDRMAVVRGQDGTTPQTFRAGSCVTVEWTAGAIKAMIAASTGQTLTGYTGTLAAPALGTYENGLLMDATQGEWVLMGFVALDGFSAFGQSPITVSDNYIRLRKADAAPLLAVASGDFTWLVLRDPVSSEIVQYVSDGDTVDVGNGLVDVPIVRQAATGTRYNYSCQNILEYRVTTPVVSEIVRDQLAALGLSAT